jgi:hypothetical protein
LIAPGRGVAQARQYVVTELLTGGTMQTQQLWGYRWSNRRWVRGKVKSSGLEPIKLQVQTSRRVVQ